MLAASSVAIEKQLMTRNCLTTRASFRIPTSLLNACLAPFFSERTHATEGFFQAKRLGALTHAHCIPYIFFVAQLPSRPGDTFRGTHIAVCNVSYCIRTGS